MAHIKTLKDNELIGGQDNTDVYPVSTTQAIFSQKPDGTVPEGIKHQRLEERLEDHEEDAQELHRKSEKMAVYINNDKNSQTLEITGEVNIMNITGNVMLETYGDEPAEEVSFDNLTVKRLTITSGAAILIQVDNWNGNYSYTMPTIVGSYTARFDATYNNVAKHAMSTTNLNLRKYFGFADTQPVSPESLAISHFSNSVDCTVTIPANDTGFKHIYFAVPAGMTITRVVQPDALNAPLAIQQIGTTTRVIGETSYTYKLYQSVDEIDASVNKRLTIS